MTNLDLRCSDTQIACGSVYWFSRYPETQLRLRKAIELMGYRIQLFNNMADLGCTEGGEIPSLVIAEVDDWKDERLFQELGCIQREMLDSTMVVVLSEQKDLDSRLRASHLGCDRFLHSSIDTQAFAEEIFRLIGDPATLCNYRVAVLFNEQARLDNNKLLESLNRAGIETQNIHNPREVLETSSSFNPDLFLLSFSLPNYSGMDMAAVIHQDTRWPDIPILLLSSEEEISFISSGMLSVAEVVVSSEAASEDLVPVILGRIKQGRGIRNRRERLENLTREQNYEHQALDAHAIVSVTNARGQITSVNEKFCEVSGFNSEELIGKTHSVINSGYHPREFFVDMWRTISAGKIWQGEVCNRRKDGNLYWVSSTIMPFMGVDGIPYKYVSIRTDITDQKETELALRASEERFARSQTFANIGTWDWNIQTGELYWSEAIGPLFGYPDGQLETTYENFLDTVHPDDRQKVIDAVNDCVQGKAEYRIEHRCVWPDGRVRWMQENGDVTRDHDGNPLHMLGVVQDITVRKLAEQSLRSSEARLANAQRIAHIGDWEWDIVEDKLVWSDEIYRIFGQQPGSFEPSISAFYSVVHPDDMPALRESERRAFEGQGHDVIHRIILPDGEFRFVHEFGEVIFDSQGTPVRMSGTVQDVTRRELVDQELIRQKEAAEKASMAKSMFLSNMSHELRTPLNAILGFAQYLEMNNEETLTGTQLDSIAEIYKAGRHLLDLINDVLDLSRIDAGKVQISLESVSFVEIIDECLSLIRPLAANQNLTVYYDAECECRSEDVYLRADAIRLKQVLLNLLSNAVKYNCDGGSITVSCKIDPENDNYIRISVEDTGSGISEEDLPELFKAFNRLVPASHAVEGTGIGLALSQRLIWLMDGDIGVTSELGKGSCFWITVQRDNAYNVRSVECESESSELISDCSSQKKIKVLYIEDNPANMRLVQKLLEKFGDVRLVCAQNAKMGLGFASHHSFDIVLVDINLPDMNGYEVLQQLKQEEHANTPILAISANALPEDIEKGMACGFSEYFTKPLDVQRFMGSIRNYIDSCHAAGKCINQG